MKGSGTNFCLHGKKRVYYEFRLPLPLINSWRVSPQATHAYKPLYPVLGDEGESCSTVNEGMREIGTESVCDLRSPWLFAFLWTVSSLTKGVNEVGFGGCTGYTGETPKVEIELVGSYPTVASGEYWDLSEVWFSLSLWTTEGAQDSQPPAGGRYVTFHGMTLGRNGCVSWKDDEGHMILKGSQDGYHYTIGYMTANRRASVRVWLHNQLKMYSYTSSQANIREWAGVRGGWVWRLWDGVKQPLSTAAEADHERLPLGRSGECSWWGRDENSLGAVAQWGVSAIAVPSNSKGITWWDLPLPLLDHAGPLWALSVTFW